MFGKKEESFPARQTEVQQRHFRGWRYKLRVAWYVQLPNSVSACTKKIQKWLCLSKRKVHAYIRNSLYAPDLRLLLRIAPKPTPFNLLLLIFVIIFFALIMMAWNAILMRTLLLIANQRDQTGELDNGMGLFYVRGKDGKTLQPSSASKKLLAVVEAIERMHEKNLISVLFVLPDPTNHSMNVLRRLLKSRWGEAYFLFASTSSNSASANAWCSQRTSVFFEQEPLSDDFFTHYLRCFLATQLFTNVTENELIANFSNNNTTSSASSSTKPVFLFDFVNTVKGGFCTSSMYHSSKKFSFVRYLQVEGTNHFLESVFRDSHTCLNATFSSQRRLSEYLNEQQSSLELCFSQVRLALRESDSAAGLDDKFGKRCFGGAHNAEDCAFEECVLRHSCISQQEEHDLSIKTDEPYVLGGMKLCEWTHFLPALFDGERVHSVINKLLFKKERAIFVSENTDKTRFIELLFSQKQ